MPRMPETPRAGEAAPITVMGHWAQRMLPAIGLAAGLGLAYLDSLPTWDDSGILAGGMLLVSGVLALMGGRPAWLVALAVGMWIPARAIAVGGHPLTALVVIFAFLGAYAGTFIRAGLAGAANSIQSVQSLVQESLTPPDREDHGEQAETE
jgi:hypothetical protein